MNKKRKRQTRLAASVLALALVTGGNAAFAADPAQSTQTTSFVSVRTSFNDVLPNFWYTKHISKLAALGIIEGYPNGGFMPDNAVTQQEAVVMAIRMMGLESEVKKQTDFVLPVTADSFFRPYIALAFDKGLLSQAEETEGTSAQKTAWGSRTATREWVTKIVIRAAGKETEAKQVSTTPSSFQDAKEFSPWALGYINEAYLLKIVNGIDDYNFGPKNNVTRAQMATFLSRADQYLTKRSDRVMMGYAMDITDKKLTVMDAKNQTFDFNVNSDTVIFNAKNDNKIAISAIKQTYEVYVVAAQGNAYYIELTNDEEKMDSMEGQLSSVFLDSMMVALKQNGKDNLIALAANVTATDKEGRGISLSSIPAGSKVELKKSRIVPNSKVSQIIVKETPVSKTSEGSIVATKNNEGKMTLLEQSTSLQETFAVSNLVKVVSVDGAVMEFGKLKAGDIVTYEVVNNEIVTIAVRKPADFTASVQGTLTSISPDKTIITINKTGSALEAYYIADNAIVSIDGLSNAGLFDLEVGDSLKLELLNNKVVGVNVMNRSINSIVFATIINYDSESKILTLQNNNGDVAAYKMSDSTSIIYNGYPLQFKDFTSRFTDEKGRRVDVKANKDKITWIQLSTDMEGTVTQINTSSNPNELTVRVGNGQNINFKVSPGIYVDVLGKNGVATMSDLKVGDLVKVSLNRDQETVTKVTTRKTAVYKVLYKNSSERQISVKEDTGALSVYKVDNNSNIFKAGQASGSYEDIGIDEFVKISFSGNSIDKVELLNTVRGKVTAIDATTGSLTVQDYSGGVQVATVGKNFVVKTGGTSSAALNTIKLNDRVEVIKDASDKVVINVAAASKRTVASYDYVLNQLILKPTANSDKTTFNFFAKAYLHKGTTAVSQSSFVENDEIMIYVLDDKIIEIEK